MKKLMRFLSFAAIGAAGCALAWLAGSAGPHVGGAPVLFWCALAALAINWAAAIPAILRQTEHFYDLTGSLTYLSVTALALWLAGPPTLQGWLVTAMVVIWAARLGSMLFLRIRAAGEDKRFQQIKRRPDRFFGAWTMQALWVMLTVLAALVVITTASGPPTLLFWIGAAVWLAGFAIEVVADRQKAAFRADPANAGRYITSGLWAWSQHPNYFGEIMLWTGIAIAALPQLAGWSWLALVSPLFAYVLLTRISGIPLLAAQARERWGDEPEWRAHVKRTSRLFPLPPGQ